MQFPKFDIRDLANLAYNLGNNVQTKKKVNMATDEIEFNLNNVNVATYPSYNCFCAHHSRFQDKKLVAVLLLLVFPFDRKRSFDELGLKIIFTIHSTRT